MKWWKPLLIFLLCATPSWAGFWSDFPGVGPGTVLNDVIIDNSTINSSTLNQPIINDPTFNGTSTYNPGTVINYDPSTIINGPDGSIWYYNGIDNLKNLTIAVGGSITLPPGSTLNLPDGSVWTDQGLSTLNIQAGGVITIGGVPAGGACPANQFYIALSSALVPTCAPVTNIPGPVTINQATFTGNTTMPDGSIWSVGGIFKSTPLNFATTINITGTGGLTFNGTPVGGTCPADQFVYAISPTLVPVCATPAGGGGGGTIPTPVSVANGGLGQGAPPSVGQILVANGPTSYLPVTMTGDATINSAGQITVNSINGVTGPFQPLTSTSTTAPTNPIDGQFWFDPTTLQTYIWYTDPTSSQWVAVVNLTGATLTNPILNNPTLNNATFTGTVTFPNGSIADSALAGAYSGVGACATGLFVTALNRNAPPTCNPAGVIVSATPPAAPVDSQLWFNSTDLQTYLRYNDGSSTQWVPVINLSGATLNNPTITNPTFLGTLQFPDGSYYDTNGHEIMKNLGVGMVAYTDGANAGSGTVYGNSIAVKGSGWDNTAAPNGYWDDSGLEQMYGLNSKWLDLGQPSAQVDGWGTIHGDVNNAALNNPWAELDLTNQSAYAGGAMDTGYDQRWQAEGFQNLNAIGIHQQTWEQGCTSVTVTAGITGAGAYLSDCAVAATASSFNNNLNYKILLTNNATTAAGEASVLLGNSTHTGGMYLTGTGFAATATAKPDQMIIITSAANGVTIPVINSNPFTVGSATQQADLRTGGTGPLNTSQLTSFVGVGTEGPQIQLIGPNSSVSENNLGAILWGSPGNTPGTPIGTPPSSAGKVGALIQATSGGGSVEPSGGLQFATAPGDGTSAKVTMELARDGTLILPNYAGAGNFLGGPGTIDVSNGYFINGVRLGAAQNWTPQVEFGGSTAGVSEQIYYAYYTKVGNQVTVSFGIGNMGSSSATGNWQICGLPPPVVGGTNQGVWPVMNFGGVANPGGTVAVFIAGGSPQCLSVCSLHSDGSIPQLTNANAAGANLQGAFSYVSQ